MALVSRIGNMLKQARSKHISIESSLSNLSLCQAVRCMSSSKLFVGGLPYSMDDRSLGEEFAQHGEVIEARVIVDQTTGRSRGFGFVSYTSSEEASSAKQAMDGQDLQGRRVKVDFATDRPPRQGGYGGGSYGGGNRYGGGGNNYGGGYGNNGGGGHGGGNNYGGGYGNYGGGGNVGSYGGGNVGGYGGNSGGYGGGNDGGYGGGNSGGYGGGNSGGYGGGNSGGYGVAGSGDRFSAAGGSSGEFGDTGISGTDFGGTTVNGNFSLDGDGGEPNAIENTRS